MKSIPELSTAAVAGDAVPRHVAIIMDGNGRWAARRHLPRVAGHKKGVDSVRATVEGCARRGIEFLTLFAFSSENWRRPAEEVSLLMRLFMSALEREVLQLDKNRVRLRVVGDLSALEPRLRELIVHGEARTLDNPGMTLTIAANYGGRWDILQAVEKSIAARLAMPPSANASAVSALSALSAFREDSFEQHLAMSYAPDPDLFIRTGGEQRVSNFMLWQLAYTELYFTQTYWPDFDDQELELAISAFRNRERRFGRTSAQVSERE